MSRHKALVGKEVIMAIRDGLASYKYVLAGLLRFPGHFRISLSILAACPQEELPYNPAEMQDTLFVVWGASRSLLIRMAHI
jgi:hypothetical protein